MVINPLDDLLTYPQGLGAAKRTANQLTIPELVRALRQIDPHKRVLAFRLLEKDKAIAVFEALTPDEQATLIEGMTDPEILHFLEALEADQRVRLFEELPAKVTKRLLSQLSSESRDAVNLLLGYPEGTIGRRMNLRYLALRQDLTVEQAIAAIRESSLDINDLSIIFVIDEQRFYRGFVQPIQLMKANPHQPLQDLVQGQELAIAVTAPELSAAKLLKEYDVPAIPVVDQEGRLVGDITFDDVIDLIEEEATSTILAQAGVGNLLNRDQAWSERLVRGPIRYAVQLRIICLIITLIGGMIVGGVIQYFEEVLEAVVAVAIFIPVVMDMGGNVGTQSTTVFARGLAWQHIDIRRYGGYLFREFRIGAIMGLILGTAGGLIAFFWQGLPNDIPQLGLAVGISLFVVITFAAILGALLPWVLLKLGFDHGPAADPFITTIKDFTGLLLYFYLVSVFLGLSF
ncbi:magnesium transporter [Thermosynechococcus sp. JY1334]|uniref:magnesium transporter n=1 Tax=unclassified Thermosynechococcus TaxID=2622553 RepID=UPI002670DDFE|nr:MULTISPECIES: magnesium transporter [unclassified Thermosynechococcus]MDR5638017.1 magnesium transporter [Thermosynechococcus sp. PP42]MDR7898873.1 magnesium transporter [Thermosynechococcus sp. JY1332]MDR7906278.1 magnesium transporter [Thermosynechococcus sp. JY1334]MDR7921218.1 magnesium transporter [Thermosynechococcus sp. HY213]MDR7994098.1 magnesium transporter [Thermosynechococcus sp. TG252]